MTKQEVRSAAQECLKRLDETGLGLQERLDVMNTTEISKWPEALGTPIPAFEAADRNDRAEIRLAMLGELTDRYGSKLVMRNSMVRNGSFTHREFDDWWECKARQKLKKPEQRGQSGQDRTDRGAKKGRAERASEILLPLLIALSLFQLFLLFRLLV